MEKKEIIFLGTHLGLKFNLARDHSEKYVIFEGEDSQAFSIPVGEEKEITLCKLGAALINFGRKQKSAEILEAINEI